jgi:hypothetical protein
MEIVALLLVKLGKSIEICQICSRASFNRIELLLPGSEMELLSFSFS